jgi:hypothetical protein
MLWGGLSDFNIAHSAMIDELASILGRRLGYDSNAHAICAGGAKYGRFYFEHDTQLATATTSQAKR